MRLNQVLAVLIAVLTCSLTFAQSVEVPLNIGSGFNGDAIISPGEVQQCYLDGTNDYRDLYGIYPTPHGNWILAANLWTVINTTGVDNAYSIPGQSTHPFLLSGTDGLPQDGLIPGADRNYILASFSGNDLYPGDYTQVSNPATFTNKPNCLVIGATHNYNDWQVVSVTVELPAEQKAQYQNINFILNAINSHKARGMQIVALYGPDGSDEQVIYAFNPDAADGPIMADTTAPAGYALVRDMNYHYSAYSGSTGTVRDDKTANMFEFATPLSLDDSKTLWGLRFEDTRPTVNWQSRGLAVWAATASRADTGGNTAPTANAGPDQTVYDMDVDGYEEVTLDASSSSDDETIVKFEWTEASSTVAVGINPIINLTVGTHNLTLTTTDNHGSTDSDTVIITVGDQPATAPSAEAGPTQTVIDEDDSGSETVTLDGSASTDPNGSIISWDWTEGQTTLGSGETLDIDLAIGIHTVTLTVTDDEGFYDSDTVSINVVEAADLAVYYVDQANGDDANPGTESEPWATLSFAVTQVKYGDTILVKSGIYRGMVRPEVSGLPGLPITLKAADGEHAILSGALEVTGWTQATQSDVNGNPNYGSIYYADVNWKPDDLYEDNQPLMKARIKGWWAPSASGATNGTTIVDPAHITQPDGYWEGAEVWVWETVGTAHYLADVTDHTGSTLTLSPPIGHGRYPKPEDQYYIRNKIELMDGPGQWCVSDNGDGTFRIFVWTSDTNHPDTHLVEASQSLGNGLFDWNNEKHLILDGFEIRHHEGHGVASFADGAEYITIQNCMIHHNGLTGIYGRYNNFGHYYRNYVGFNGIGIQTATTHDTLVEENEIVNNWYDGLVMNGSNITVRRNYIHGHWWWSHADNMQCWGTLGNMLVEENFIINSGQSFMMEGVQGVTFIGNVFVGSHANMIIAGHDTVNGVNIYNNTLCFTPSQLINTSGFNFDLLDNIFMHGTDDGMFGVHFGYLVDDVFVSGTFESDYNLFYTADGFPEATVHFNNVWNRTLASYQAAGAPYNLDQNSQYANPNFVNAPVTIHNVDGLRVEEFTATKIYMTAEQTIGIAIGDHIEIDWDGVVRTVTAVGADYIEFTPGDDFFFMMKAGAVLNWKENTNYALDLTPAPGSPAHGMASDGGTVGAIINTVNFANVDFDGDGNPDVWRWNGEKPAEPIPGVEAAHIFYNNSAFDGNDPAANANDDNAIDPTKEPLMPGESASIANYTCYSKGINGLMIDLTEAGNVTAADFTFKVGNDNSPAAWATAPAPVSVTVRPGAGVNGSDRVTIIWADGAISKQWLEVTVEANANTGLDAAVTGYFGNAVGETGNSASDAIVDATDEIACRNNPRNFMRPATVDNPYDHNKDAKVDATDEIIARNNTTTMANDLEMIAP